MSSDYLKLTTYFGERHRCGGKFVADVLCDLYGQHEVAVSIMLRGIEGFGLKHHLRTDHSLSLSEDLPLVSIAVDSVEQVEALLPSAVAANPHGLVTLERARLITGEIGTLPAADIAGQAVKFTVYLGRQERSYRMPTFLAVCDLLHRRGVAGAIVLLGVDGTVHGRRERAKFFSKNAEVPLMVTAVGGAECAARVLPELGALLHKPLVTVERAQICKRDGENIAFPEELPGTDEHGMALRQKLMVYSSEAALHGGQPVHRAIMRRLRAAGLSGATTLRGIWGFYGDQPPQGDRLLQLGRRVPVVTTVIDTPAQISRAFAVIDELTSEAGLVTSETVPAMRSSLGDQ